MNGALADKTFVGSGGGIALCDFSLVFIQYGWTVVHFAAYNGHLEMLQELLERYNCETDKRDKVNGVNISFVECTYICVHLYMLWSTVMDSSYAFWWFLLLYSTTGALSLLQPGRGTVELYSTW